MIENPAKDMTIEQIESNHKHLVEAMQEDKWKQWLESRPPSIQKKAKEVPPQQLYRVKENAPYKYSVPGSIVAPVSYIEDEGPNISVKFSVLRSPAGTFGYHAILDTEWLEPISLKDLRKEIEEEKINGIPEER